MFAPSGVGSTSYYNSQAKNLHDLSCVNSIKSSSAQPKVPRNPSQMSFLKKLRTRDSTSSTSSSRSTRSGKSSISSTASSISSFGKYAKLGESKEAQVASREQAARIRQQHKAVDALPSPTPKSSRTESTAASSDGARKKKKKFGGWFDMSVFATPIAVYNLPPGFDPDDPNVYWDEEVGVWRYWYHTWCPVF